MCEDVVAHALARAGDRPVARLRVRAGTLLRVDPDAFAQSFALVATGTVLQGAVVECVEVPASGRCGECGASSAVTDASSACPRCGAMALSLSGGDELVLELLEYRAPATAVEQPAPPGKPV